MTDARSCSSHPQQAAEYICDDCGKFLCGDCVVEGHRLIQCAHCGELARALAVHGPATVPAREKARKRAAPYSLSDALAYPFRGHGPYLYGGYVVLLTILGFLGRVPSLGCLALVFQLMILFLIPGFLFAIVRSTERGEIEPPDWPVWDDFGERFAEWIGFFLVFAVGILPPVVLVGLSPCGFEQILRGTWGFFCWLVAFAGIGLGLVLAVPAFGAAATYFNNLQALRLDLHLRALGVIGGSGWVTIGVAFAVLFLSQVIRVLLLAFPLVGTLLSAAAGAYGLLVTPHLIGLLFRRHAAELKVLYVGR